MIILFHCISIIIFQLLRSRKRIKFFQNISNKSFSEIDSVNEDLEFNLKFDPPVFRQRYGRVYQTLLDGKLRTNITSLVDFGCAEFSIFVYIKRLSNLNTIFFVDIDEYILSQYSGKLHPLTIDHLKRRPEPLQICVFKGSVGDPDYRLADVDVVTAIELIEHLYPDVLDAFPYNIFNHIKPKVVIITTPNADFNVLFSNDLKRFRHYDHKFEWTREQFEEWANNIVIRFPNYAVSFSGIGEGPQGTEHLGQCSQMALFIRKELSSDDHLIESNNSSCFCDGNSPCKATTSQSKLLCSCVCTSCLPKASYGICTYYTNSSQVNRCETDMMSESENTYYKLIERIVYPYECDDRTEEEKMRDEFNYRINNVGQAWGRFFVEERNRSEIPLQDLIYGPAGFDITESEVEKLLTGLGYKVEECRIQETGLLQNCVIYEPVMEEISSTSEASGYDSDFTKYQLNEDSLSDWDEPNFKKESRKSCDNCKGFMNEQNIFPHWLLQILGSQVVGEGEAPAGSLEEPHFYCQGDGLGVHPSVIAVEIDEEDDTTDSSNNTADTAELDLDPSSQDMNSLPEDSQTVPLESNTIPVESHADEEQPLIPTTSDHHESSSSTDVGASGST